MGVHQQELVKMELERYAREGHVRFERWYVVEAFQNSVEAAYLRLAAAGLKVWMPVDVKRAANRSRSGAPRRDLRVPRFGRYFFVHADMSDALQHAIDNTPCVCGLLRANGSDSPAPIPDDVIEWLRRPPSRGEQSTAFVVGDTVRIVDGPFTHWLGKVDAIDKRGVVKLTLDVDGRSTPIVIPVEHVEMAQQAKSRAISTFQRPGKASPARVRKH